MIATTSSANAKPVRITAKGGLVALAEDTSRWESTERFIHERWLHPNRTLRQGIKFAANLSWRAEHALRPAVVTRKVCGGNRSPRGAETQEVLASILRTAHQRQLNPHAVLISLLRARTPAIAVELRDRAVD